MAEGTTGDAVQEKPRVRVDWRTGQPMVEHGDAFWQEHERHRIGQGLTVSQYCTSNGLAVSTYRHRVSGNERAGARSGVKGTGKAAAARTPAGASERTAAFVAVAASRMAHAAVAIEIALDGMTMRLHGEAADRVLDQVVRRLA